MQANFERLEVELGGETNEPLIKRETESLEAYFFQPFQLAKSRGELRFGLPPGDGDAAG